MTVPSEAPGPQPNGSRRSPFAPACLLVGGRLAAACLLIAGGLAVATAATAAGAGSPDDAGQGGTGSPAESASATPPSIAQPLGELSWQQLSGAQREILQPFAAQWNSLPAAEKRTWIVLADRLPDMHADARQRARQRISQWAGLTPEQRRLARMNYRLARQLPPDERKAQWERYTSLTSEQQRVLRNSGWTSNTAAGHAGARTGLAKEAAQPLAPFHPLPSFPPQAQPGAQAPLGAQPGPGTR